MADPAASLEVPEERRSSFSEARLTDIPDRDAPFSVK
jgi:hypothetical protein